MEAAKRTMKTSINYKKRDLCLLVLIVVFALLLPLLLNWLLRKPAICEVIGDEETWLNFWATYIGAILTALMVFASFITIRKTINLSISQRRIEWLHSFREASADLLQMVDPMLVNALIRSIRFDDVSKVMAEAHQLDLKIKRCSFILTAILEEYDDVFLENKSSDYIKKINHVLSPYLRVTEEVVQFAIFTDHLVKKRTLNDWEQGVLELKCLQREMQQRNFDIIANAIDKLDDQDPQEIIRETSAALQTKFADVDTASIKEELLSICQMESKIAHKSSFVLLTMFAEKV